MPTTPSFQSEATPVSNKFNAYNLTPGAVAKDFAMGSATGLGLSALSTRGRKGFHALAKPIARTATNPDNKGALGFASRRLGGWLSGNKVAPGMTEEGLLQAINAREAARTPWMSGEHLKNTALSNLAFLPAYYGLNHAISNGGVGNPNDINSGVSDSQFNGY
jgi:hypothetical protein